jgi:hypothetical protein
MSNTNTFSGNVKVWTTSKLRNIDYVLDALKQGETQEIVSNLQYSNHDMSDVGGWAEIGVATISITLHPQDDIVSKELQGLNAQLQKVRADNMMRENAILDRISKLTAITYEGGEA